MHLEHAGKRRPYLTAAFVAIAGYLVFFSSTFWYPGQKTAAEYTPIGQMQEIGETGNSVTIVYWAYAQTQNAMSVELDISTASEDVMFTAVDKTLREIPVTVMLSESGTYVIKLEPVRTDFQAVSLRVTVQDKTVRLYTNEKQVALADELTFYSNLDGYYKARISRNILALEQEIQQTNDSIRELDEEISCYQEKIRQANARMPYLPQNRRSAEQNMIAEWEKQIEDYQEQQKKEKEQVSQLTDEMNTQRKLFAEGSMEQSTSESDTCADAEEKQSMPD